ncbi:MAG: glycosyltransferase [Muribaculaceae bacterium]|nr:glycosyltransferase [Muribaculaceae bacterium]
MISIIVPAYNVEAYLASCIGSILGSTCRDIELILVDDGSTDGTGIICDEWAAKDERIIVIHQENIGISGARNTGMSRARGNFVAFVDSDDLVHPLMFETLLNAIQSGNYDFSMVLGMSVDEGMISSFSNDSVDIVPYGKIFKCISQKKMMCELYAQDSYQYKVVWNKLYRKSLIEGMRFKDLASEDFEWNNRVFLKARRAILIEKELYCYVQHPESVMHQGLNHAVIDRLNTVMECLNGIPESERGYRANCLIYLYKSFSYVRYQCAACQQSLTDGIKVFGKDMYAKTRKELLGSDVPLMTKITMIVSYLCPSLYRSRMSIIEGK